MPSSWENYLNNLKLAKGKDYELSAANKSMGRFTEPFNIVNRKMQSVLNLDKASIGAKIQAGLRGQQQIQGMQEQVSNTAIQAKTDRMQKSDTEIAKAQLAVDQEQEQKKAEKQAKNTQLLRQGMQVGGALIGLASGGVGGMALGGSIGKAASGFVGIDSKGHLSADPEEMDLSLTIEGMQEAGGMLAQNATQKEAKAKMAQFTAMSPKIGQIINTMDSTQAQIFGTNLNYLLSNPNTTPEELMAYINGYGSTGYAPTYGLTKDKIREKLYPKTGTDMFMEEYGR